MPQFQKRTAALAVHRPNPLKGKVVDLEDRLSRVKAKAREAVKKHEGAAITVGTALVGGVLQSRGTELPTVANIDPFLLYGALGAVLADRMPGKNGALAMSASLGLLSVAAQNAGNRGGIFLTDADKAEAKAKREAHAKKVGTKGYGYDAGG